MKKFGLLFLAVFAFKAGAQGYQRMLDDSITQFRVIPLYIPVLIKGNNQQTQSTNCSNAMPGDFYTKTDSVYNGNVYKKFTNAGNSFLGLIREDTSAKKVYFIQYCNTNEELLYDFSLQVGDSINYSFSNSNNYIINGWYKLDSIKYRHDYSGYYRKHFYMHNRLNSTVYWGGFKASLEMIEGVGNTNHPLFLYYWFNLGEMAIMGSTNSRCFNTQYDELLTCKWNKGTKVYFDSCAYTSAQANPCINHNDSCLYGTSCSGVEEFAGLKSITVYPNPATDMLTLDIETEKQIDLSFSLKNILGIEVKKENETPLLEGKNSIHLNLNDLREGIYLLQIYGEEKTISKTIIIQR